MASSVPHDEAQSYAGGRPLENKRPRTYARYLSPLHQPNSESDSVASRSSALDRAPRSKGAGGR
eukprot:6786779-Pyramimonas_sp.AAC.1